MKRIVILFFLLALGLVSVGASADAAPGPGLLQRIATLDGNTTAFVQRGDFLYAATGVKVSVYDVSDPAHPQLLADSPLMPEVVRDIDVTDNFLFAADDIGGLWVFSIQPDHQLLFLRHILTNAIVSHVKAQGDRAYVVGWKQGHGFLNILQISDAGVKTIGGAEIQPDLSALDVAGDTVFITKNYALYTYDVSNPAQVRFLDSYKMPSMDEFSDMQVSDGVAYILAQQVSGMESVLITVDVSDPATLHELAFVNLTFRVWTLSLQQDTLYLAGVFPGIHIIDVSDPANPQVQGAYHAMAETLLAAPTLLFTSNGPDDIQISDISDPATPRLAGVIPKLGYIGKAIPRGDRLYTLTDWNRFSIFDISDPAHPQLLGADRAGDGASIEDFVVADGVAYQAFRRFDSETMETSHALRVLDISDPTDPREIARYPLAVGAHQLAYAAPYLYLATDIHLLVFDVSDPSHPDLLSFAISGFTLRDMLASDGVLYTTIEYRGMKIWDVADPYLPEQAAFIYTPGRTARALDRHGDQIIIADGRGELSFIDVSQPDAPKLQMSIPCDVIAQHVAVAGDALFAVCYDMGQQFSLHAYDLSDPEHPQARAATYLKRHQYGAYYVPFDALSAEDDLIFFNAGDGGLQVFRYLPPAHTRHLWLPAVHLPAASPFLSPPPTPTPSSPARQTLLRQ